MLLYPTPHCILCLLSAPGIDSYNHFLLLCPMKIRVWCSIFSLYISSTSLYNDTTFY
ncbi:hypothetical protein BDB01DRAFT_777517, partial [Pilobolus umbonatus]